MPTTIRSNLSQPQIQPVLASTLLTFEAEGKPGGVDNREGYRTGVKVLDHDLPSDVLGPEKVVGICGVGSMHTYSQHLVHSLIATHLLTTVISTSSPLANNQNSSALPMSEPPSKLSPPASSLVYLIEPRGLPGIESPLLRIYNLLEARIQRTHQMQKQAIFPDNRPQQNTNIDDLIDAISVIPYFDLLGISQALSEISEKLRVQSHIHQIPPDVNTPQGKNNKGTIILLRGLGDTLASQMSRPGNHTSVFSLLTNVLRQLKRISRSQDKSVLVLLEVGATIDERKPGNDDDIRREGTGTGGGGSDAATERNGLKSVFSSPDGRMMRICLDTTQYTRGSVSISPAAARPGGRYSDESKTRPQNFLAGMLEDGLDGLVVLHDGFGTAGRNTDTEKCVVEVVKDRLGGAFGSWAVWDVNGERSGMAVVLGAE